MNSSACWHGCHEDCWDFQWCACVCHRDWATWQDADVRTYAA